MAPNGWLQAIATAILRNALRFLFKPLIRPPVPITWQRRIAAAIALVCRSAPGVEWRTSRSVDLALATALPPSRRPGRVILYLHGGAYCLGSPQTHRGLVTHLALASASEVVVPDYRLAPEHPYPAALDDALQCYRSLLQRGVAAQHIRLAGDSAGAGLALALALRLREEKLPMPAALLLISPWVDLTLSGESVNRLRQRDPMLAVAWPAQAAGLYAGQHRLDHPGCSPLFADLHNLPPMLIQVGSDEILLDDARRLAARVSDAGGAVTLQEFAGMWHVFQNHAGILAVSDRAIQSLADFAAAP